MSILRLHHAQITIPQDAEEQARQFYCDLLGLPEIEKPDALKGRGGFWLSSVRDQGAFAPPNTWPTVAIIIPARDEAEGIAASVGSLLAQDYAGPLRIILVDDGSIPIGAPARSYITASLHQRRNGK